MKFQKNYKIPFLSFLLFYFSIQLFSQQSVIQGIVKDSLTQGTITYAAIYLRNDKDSVVSYVYTDEQGSFKLPVSDITKGSLFVEMLGYNKWTKTLDFSGETRFFEQIFLSPNVNLLGEIEISDSANKVVHRLDRDIHVIDKQLIEKSQNIYDILKTLPGVVVDEASNTIRFKGSAPEVLVDNFPAGYMYPDLRIIDINNIEKIELIDKSSIYGGAGEGGIINIKMKKEKQKTFGMYLGTDVNYGISDNIFVPQQSILNLNANFGKVMVFNNLWANTYTGKSKIEGEGTLNFQDNIFSRIEDKTSTYSQTYFTDILGIMLNYDKFSILIADQFMFSKWYDKENTTQTTILDTLYRSITQQNINRYNHYFFNKVLAKFSLSDFHNQDVELMLNMLNSCFNNPQTDEIVINSDVMQNEMNTINSENNISKNLWDVDLYSADLQYRYRITQASQLNFHANYLFGNAPKYDRNYFRNGIEDINLQEISNFKIHQLPIGIGFAQRIKKFTIDATLNYKFQQFKGDFQRYIESNDTTLLVNIKYNNLEPSIRLKYNIDSINDLYLGYSYSVSDLENNDWSKPIQYYVSYIDKSNPLSWQSGNSDLQAEKLHKLYFQYRMTKEKLNFNAEIFFLATNNGINTIRIPISPEITLNKYENIASSCKIGTNLSFYYKISNQWNLWLNSSIYYSNMQTNALKHIAEKYQIDIEQINQNNFEATGNFTIQYFLKTRIGMHPNIVLWCNLYSKEITLTGYDEPYFGATISFRTNFFKDRLFFNLSLYNFLSPFIKLKSHYDYMGYVANYKTNSFDRNMKISLSLGLNLFAGDRGTKDYKL